MAEILSKAEIEALISSLGGAETAPKVAKAAALNAAGGGKLKGVGYEPYDFRRPDKLSKDQLRTLQMLHETFARQAASSLSASLRSPVAIELISLEQIPYDEYLRSIGNSVFAITSLPPLSGQTVVEMEFSLVFTMIDRMLGGPGRSVNRNNLTDIERPLLRQLIERMFASLKQAWEGVVVVNPSVDAIETSSQFVAVAPPNDIVLAILFEVKTGETRHAMSLCIPYLVIKPVTAKLSAQKWFATSGRKNTPNARRLLAQQVASTTVECAVVLGRAKLDFRRFGELREGDVLRLDQRTDGDLVLLVGEVPKYAGKPILAGKRVVFSVTEPIAP